MNNYNSENQYGIQKYHQRNLPPYTSGYVDNPDYGRPKEEVHLRDYLNVILRRKWVVLITLISFVIATSIFTYTMVPVYQSTVVIKIEKESQNPLAIAGLPIGNAGVDYYTTHYEILKSQSLAEKVIKTLNLDNNKEFLPVESKLSILTNKLIKAVSYPFTLLNSEDVKKDISKQIPAQDAVQGPINVNEKKIPLYLVNSLIGRLDVAPVKNSQLVKVSFSSNNPILTYEVANQIAESYIEYDLESRVIVSREAKQFLEDQINITKAKLEDSEKQLNAYSSKNEIIFLDNGNQSIPSKELSDINSALGAATSERIQKEMLLKEVKSSGKENTIILNNVLILELKKQHAALEGEYFNLLKTYTPDYPKMVNMKSQIDTIQARIDLEKSKVIKSIESDYNSALEKERYIKKIIDKEKGEVINFQDKAAEYQTLKREAEANRQLHNELLHTLTEVSVAAMSKASNIQVIDRARIPVLPYKPNKVNNILISIFLGLTSGCGLVFFMEYFDKSIKDTSDIENETHISTLGMIPYIKNYDLLITQKMPQFQGAESNTHRLPAITDSIQGSSFVEAFRTIGTFILLSSSPKQPKTILITSMEKGVGKTTISINTAKALTELQGNVIIIDSDLRRPQLHTLFDMDNTTGLSSILSGDLDFNELHTNVIKPSSLPGLSIITSGPLPANPAKLLVSPVMKNLLAYLYTQYDYIIIDAPPLLGLPDSVYLGTIADSTILVVRSGKTPKEALSEVKKVFRHSHAKILGVILNGVKENVFNYGNYYSSYFGKEDH